jgi:hypothetical protein
MSFRANDRRRGGELRSNAKVFERGSSSARRSITRNTLA